MKAPYAVTKGGGSLAQEIRERMLTDRYGNWVMALGEVGVIRLAERMSEDLLSAAQPDGWLDLSEAIHAECLDEEIYEEAMDRIDQLERSVSAKELRP